jgi:hypothetical protein
MTNDSHVTAPIPADLFEQLDIYLSRTDLTEDQKIAFIRELCADLRSPSETPTLPEITLRRAHDWN